MVFANAIYHCGDAVGLWKKNIAVGLWKKNNRYRSAQTATVATHKKWTQPLTLSFSIFITWIVFDIDLKYWITFVSSLGWLAQWQREMNIVSVSYTYISINGVIGWRMCTKKWRTTGIIYCVEYDALANICEMQISPIHQYGSVLDWFDIGVTRSFYACICLWPLFD